MGSMLFIGNIGPWEMIIILAIVLVLFGGRKIPQLAKDLGTGIREFRKTLSGTEEELRDSVNSKETSKKDSDKTG